MQFKIGQQAYLVNRQIYTDAYQITVFDVVILSSGKYFTDVKLSDGRNVPVHTRDLRIKNQQLEFDFTKE